MPLNRRAPRFVIDIAVSGRQETGAVVAGELAVSTTHAHRAVHPVRLSKLQGRPIRVPRMAAGGLYTVLH